MLPFGGCACVVQARAASFRSQLLVSGVGLAATLAGGEVGAARAAAAARAEEDVREALDAAGRAHRSARLHLARAAHAHYLAGEAEQCLRLLETHGVGSSSSTTTTTTAGGGGGAGAGTAVQLDGPLRRVWPSMNEDLLKMAGSQQVSLHLSIGCFIEGQHCMSMRWFGEHLTVVQVPVDGSDR